MDPSDPAQGQETPPDPSHDITYSVKGRQRKKNTKYLDFQTGSTRNVQQKTPRRNSEGKAASKRTPAKSSKPHDESQLTADTDADDKTAEEPNGKISEETQKNATGGKRSPARKTPAKKSPAKKTPAKKTPAKKTPAKKTPAKKTPAKKTPAKKTPASSDGGVPSQEGEGVNVEKQENGTPKRKYVRKQPRKELEPVTDPPCEEVNQEPPKEPEEDQTQPGGRRRRGAAKAALKYLHILAKEVLSGDESSSRPGDEAGADPDQKGPKGGKGRRGRKRKRSDSSGAEDEDFVPDVEVEDAEEAEEEEDEVDEDEPSDLDFRRARKSPASSYVSRTTGSRTPNGLNSSFMKVIWTATETTKKFREDHYSSWEFPEWVPSSTDWHPVPQSDVEKYLPQELQSAAFSVSRDGLQQEKTPPQRLSRFSSLPSHPQRWDSVLFAGGPVWAMEWCPTPDGAQASQYIALACHRGMDDRHYVNKTYQEPGLVQLWDVGPLQYNSRPESQPALVYGLAQDKGFIWQIKWCPAGGWEPPSSDRQTPSLPRLGLLAVATSACVVTIYSLPHPDALHASKKQETTSGADGRPLPLYQATGVLTLKLGAFRTPRHAESGQVLSMDWLPKKPHNIIAIGFYDGVVGLWDLSTKSTLLRVREPDKSLCLLPYRCFLAHDHAVRALAFCPASRDLLVTAGEDRWVKTWDLRRLWNPVTALKRYLTNEIYWPLNAPGFMLAQETAYTAKGTQGVHFFDHHARSYYAIARVGTLWSLSYSDWLNTVVTSDSFGDLIFALLPHISFTPQYMKRTIERRFPIYLTSLVPYDTSEGGSREVGGAGEERDAAEGKRGGKGGEGGGGGETEGEDAGSEGGNDSETERNGGRGGGRGGGGGGGGGAETPPKSFQTYREAVKKYRLHMTDSNMLTFAGIEKRPVWKRMRDTEMKMKLNMDDMPLGALHKVRFNPNMCCQTWIVSGGQAGLVRLNCLRNLTSSQTQDLIRKSQAQNLTSSQTQGLIRKSQAQNLISSQSQDVISKSQTQDTIGQTQTQDMIDQTQTQDTIDQSQTQDTISQTQDTIDQSRTQDTISIQTKLSALDPPKEDGIQTVIL